MTKPNKTNKLLDKESISLKELRKKHAALRVKLIIAEDIIDKERKRKSFWFWLNSQFRMKP